MQHDEKLQPQTPAILESGPVDLVASSTGKAPQSSFAPSKISLTGSAMSALPMAGSRHVTVAGSAGGTQPYENERRRRVDHPGSKKRAAGSLKEKSVQRHIHARILPKQDIHPDKTRSNPRTLLQ